MSRMSFSNSVCRWFIAVACVVAPGLGISSRCQAQDVTVVKAAAAAAKPAEEKKKFPDWDKVLEGTKKLEGLFSLYYDEKGQKLFMEIQPSQCDRELILPMAIARGAGMAYLGGETLNFGEQWLISFRRVADRIHVIRRNIRFQAQSGTPQADAVKLSYNDSVIKALSVKSERGGSVLVDLADLLMTDLANIGIHPDSTRSTWAKVKVFPKNVEIEVSAVFAGAGRGLFAALFGSDAIPDTRGTQIVIHYGLSMLPSTSYKTRLADDRVGHFLSTVKDFSKDIQETPTVRYVTRWNLEKVNASADKSPPKQPVIFWIERTVPREYRQYVREGILEWNKAFEKVGFIDAIQVRDQQADDEFDPEDIRYNTIRWITTSAGFAMGPSRTNPKTGEILDADIIFDEGMIRYYRQEYIRTLGIPEGIAMLAGGQQQAFQRLFAAEIPTFDALIPELGRLLGDKQESVLEHFHQHGQLPAMTGFNCPCSRCLMGPGMQRQIGLIASVMAAKGDLAPGAKVPEKVIAQAVKEVVMHEVGHTLGLRHNFKASTAMSLQDINNPEITARKGNSGSIMDYLPANIAPKGQKQGDYFSPTIGPYDYWAIEYAYRPVDGSEAKELAKIASRAPEADLTFGTDEDLYMNPDPRINAFDMGDPLDFAKQRIKMVQGSFDGLADRVVEKGEGWQRARTAFSMLLGELAQATTIASHYVGGEYTSRDHRGDANARPPMQPIDLAKQREAIKLLADEILSAKAFQFKPALLRQLAPEHWRDDLLSMLMGGGYEYPVLQRVASIQRIVLKRFLDGGTLSRLQEYALQADDPQKTLQLSEVFDALTVAIWSELPVSKEDLKNHPKINLTTIRRNLQREHVRSLSRMVLGAQRGGGLMMVLMGDSGGTAPADARSLARQHLRQIETRIERVLKNKAANVAQLDAASRAHLEEVQEQIQKVFKAPMQMSAP